MSAPAHARETVGLLFELLGHVRAHFTEACAAFDLTPMQGHALHLLDEPHAMRQVAEGLHCDASNVTGIVDRLEERGLVERQVDPADRRRKNLVLTADGQALRRALGERLLVGHPLVVGLDAEERAALRGLLERAVTRLRDTGAAAGR